MCIASIKCFSYLICRENLTIFVNFLFSSSWELNKSMFTDFFCKYYCYLLLCSIEECVEKFICLFDGMKKMCGLKHYFVYDQFNSSNFCFIFNFLSILIFFESLRWNHFNPAPHPTLIVSLLLLLTLNFSRRQHVVLLLCR